MYAIEARHLSKSFRGVRAVDDLDVLVEEGEVVALLGPNGAGKTTTLMMLLGMMEPDAGGVRILGRPLPEERALALADVNFTASYVSLPSDLRVRHYLWVFADIYGVPRSRTREVLDLFRVGHLYDHQTAHLSSGQRTLIGLAKAMLNRPRLLVLDEPTASLDPEVGAEVRRVLMEEQQREGFTILMTSHNMAEIERLCRRVIFLAHGRAVADGSPADIAARYGREDLEGTFLSIAEEARR
ncbi:MAG TPA: ABC transporter ATP-binding protein [Actinomycetota bacterium]